MKSTRRLLATATMLLIVPLAGCVRTAITNDVPRCEELVPPQLMEETPPADLPQSAKLADGHDDARPWQRGFVEQTGQLEKANQRPPAIDHIYRTCLELHRKALKRSDRGFIGRLLSEAQVRRTLAGRDAAYRKRFEARLATYRADLRAAGTSPGG